MSVRHRVAYDLATSIVAGEFKLKQKVVPKWIYAVKYDGSKSSGYPLFKRKRDVHDEMFQEARECFHFMKYKGIKARLPPCTFAQKGKLSTQEERKTRLVWQYPAAMTICEGVFAQPLIDAYFSQKEDLFLTGPHGLKNHFKCISELTRESQENAAFYGWDGSQYDSSVPRFLIRDAFDILRGNIDFGKYDDNFNIEVGGSGVERRAQVAFDTIEHYFIYTPYLAPDGHLYQKSGGIPSGSHFTNLIGSIMTRIIIRTAMLLGDVHSQILCLFTNGDDSALVVRRRAIPLVLLCSLIHRVFGVSSKLEKQVFTLYGSEVFASGAFWRGNQPHRPTLDWFRLAMCSKHWISDPNVTYSRLFGLYLVGGFTDVQFCKYFNFFQTCYPLDKRQAIEDLAREKWKLMQYNIDFRRINDYFDVTLQFM